MFHKFARPAAFLAAVDVILTGATAALAEPIPAAFRDTQNNIYVTGQSPSSSVSMTYQGLLRSRDYQANSCGWILLRPSTTSPIPASFTAGGTAITTASLPTQLLPGCNNGVAQETRAANFKTNEGTVVLVGQTPGGYVTVQTPTDRVRRATANACSVARFTNSTTYQHSGATQIDLAAVACGSRFTETGRLV
ncbi:MAG: hypothetical protein KME07_08765 [Pegethrix bostrychoides GSE-TBD4-15B]|jgi:hypothetical protein|uniref:Secreted protein n=1 Tax=Pegethrix bostrychoides GSE-TBD4-15B TaxID=2839662 RepID=A0A951P9V3_9CYAN|nr:hypothetical protein [Pegethrix bostrychoides GSE-TBD4-15B]